MGGVGRRGVGRRGVGRGGMGRVGFGIGLVARLVYIFVG